MSGKPDPRTVFVVHGRNLAARNALFVFLDAIGLHPLGWSEIVKATRKGSPYIGEVLRKGFASAKAVVVAMTPDDEARLRYAYLRQDDPPYENQFTPQPRANVLFEAGMALGIHPSRTILVEFGPIRPMTDLAGRLKMNDDESSRQELAQRLETAGCLVRREGAEWLTAGDFKAAYGKLMEDIPRVITPGVGAVSNDKYVTEGVGIGKIVIGATAPEILTALGSPDVPTDPRLWLRYCNSKGVDVLFRDERAIELRFSPSFPLPLKGGPGIGTSLEDVLRVYGRPIRELQAGRNDRLCEDKVLYVLPLAQKIIYEREGVLFWFDNRKRVSQFVVFAPTR